MNYRVLIVEDDPMVAMINSQFVRKVDGFELLTGFLIHGNASFFSA